MKSIITDIYYGDVPSADSAIKADSEYAQALKEVIQIEYLLKSSLDEREIELLDKLIEGKVKIQSVVSRESFVDGFKKGARIVISVLE
ncbi:MAG: DUF6809 family protein [Eubacteriales bacterium]|jgi:hypothetical protein